MDSLKKLKKNVLFYIFILKTVIQEADLQRPI